MWHRLINFVYRWWLTVNSYPIQYRRQFIAIWGLTQTLNWPSSFECNIFFFQLQKKIGSHPKKEILHTFCWFIQKICIRNCFTLCTFQLNSLNTIYVNRSFVCLFVVFQSIEMLKSLLRCWFDFLLLCQPYSNNDATFVIVNQNANLMWCPIISSKRFKTFKNAPYFMKMMFESKMYKASKFAEKNIEEIKNQNA